MKPTLLLVTLSAIISIGFFSFLAMDHGALEHIRCIADLAGRLQGSCAVPQNATGEAASHIGIFRGLTEVPVSANATVILGLVFFAALAFSLLVLPGFGSLGSFQKLTLRYRFLTKYFEKKLGRLIALRENSPAFS